MKPHPQNITVMLCCGREIAAHIERVEGQPVALWRCRKCGKIALQVLVTLDKKHVDNRSAEPVERTEVDDPLLRAYYKMLRG